MAEHIKHQTNSPHDTQQQGNLENKNRPIAWAFAEIGSNEPIKTKVDRLRAYYALAEPRLKNYTSGQMQFEK